MLLLVKLREAAETFKIFINDSCVFWLMAGAGAKRGGVEARIVLIVIALLLVLSFLVYTIAKVADMLG
mgnify:CR=1 FL=1